MGATPSTIHIDEFHANGLHKETGTRYNQKGFNIDGMHQGGSYRDSNGIDVNGKYNPIFDVKRKVKRKSLNKGCPFCCGTGKVSVRSSLHQSSDKENQVVRCNNCMGTGKGS